MNRPTIEEQRALVRQWKETGRMLEQLRDEKLRGKPYDWEEVDALLSLGESYYGPPRLTSGLQEQQRLFMKLAPDWYKKLRGIE
ncbi:MAG: hypothetical protein JNK74_12615 [Candidatus Hydrogenedentes bacterium]|nr:hypothetical protein [Candidatus Hydrogenedentota bacterium]